MKVTKEITVILSNDEQKYKQKFLSYEDSITLSPHDLVLKEMVDEAMKCFKGPVEDCILNIKMVLK